MDKLLFNLDDAAVALGFKPRTLRKWIHEGKLNACRGPKEKLLIPRGELENYVKSLPQAGAQKQVGTKNG